MARQPTSRLQVSGYRFLVRRMEHALLRGDIRMLDDPMRSQSLAFIAGCVLAVIVVAVCAVLAFVRPNAGVGDAPIVMVRDSGALYVRVGDTFHPVLNLASARLITGDAGRPRLVDAVAVTKVRRGPLLGIPDAPGVLTQPLSQDDSAWTVCDGGTSTTVIAGHTDRFDAHTHQPSVLVSPRDGSAATTYLLYEGQRAQVDLRDPAVLWALRLEGVHARPVSSALLDAIPEAPPITAPRITGAGAVGAAPGLRVGTVVQVTGSDANDYFVVLADGIQRIGEVAANLIRVVDSQGARAIPSLPPDFVGRSRLVESLPVTTYPRRASPPLGANDGSTLCAVWLPDGPKTIVWSGDSLPAQVTPGELAQRDGDGPRVDGFAMPAGHFTYVKAVALTGGGGSGPLYLVSDTGVLFGVRDADTAKRLGAPDDPLAGPWPVLAALPRGPELSPEIASVARDSVTGPP